MTQKEKFIPTPERWHFKPIQRDDTEALAKKLNIDPLLARILQVRGIDKQDTQSIQSFLTPSEDLITNTD
ncbi:MAG: hypothetical protein HRT90_01155, partial [Candidatus Margulisbacteria bacterium]|nr:hypothetical protein [Candidatus Margulisiibacteriota bacterium]